MVTPFLIYHQLVLPCIAGVTALLSNLKIYKVQTASLLKNLATTLAPALTVIFKASLSQSSLPSQWKIANIVPIFKKGNQSNPGNYRPVSLTCSYLLKSIGTHSLFTFFLELNKI